jgi:hypothetical protein
MAFVEPEATGTAPAQRAAASAQDGEGRVS